MRRKSTTARRPSSEVSLLLSILDEGYSRKAWQGPNLRGSLRGVTAREATWRARSGRHNIWELVLHAAYWKYAVWRMLSGQKRGSFPEKGSNWFARSAGSERKWRADLALLEESHRRLREVVAGLPASALSRRPRGSKYRTATMIYGVASHDVYHTGQIQLLKNLRRKARAG
jgi:DinB family protein